MRARRISKVLLLGMAAAGSLSAQEQPKRTVTGQIGVIVLSVPAYPGSSERWVLPAPIVDLRVANRIYVGSGASGLSGGAGVILYESPALSWTADFTLMADRPESRADALAGLGDRGLGGFAGTTIALRRGLLQLTASGAKGVESKMGAFGVVGLSNRLPLPTGWFAQAGGLAVFGDEDYMMWDFGVTRAQAAQRGVLLSSGDPRLDAGDTVPYRPGAGLREWRGTLTAGRMLTSRLTLSATGALVRLEGDAARSPLTHERTSWEAGLGLSWGF